MRNYLSLWIPALAALLLIPAGCRAQSNSNPTVYSCQPTTGSLYAALNQNSQTTALNYTDTHPPAGVYCYYAQSTIGAQISLASNTAGPFTLSGTNSAQLTWTGPVSGPAPTGYLVSRAPATASTLLAPILGTGNVAEVKPALSAPDDAKPAYALVSDPPLKLRGSVVR